MHCTPFRLVAAHTLFLFASAMTFATIDCPADYLGAYDPKFCHTCPSIGTLPLPRNTTTTTTTHCRSNDGRSFMCLKTVHSVLAPAPPPIPSPAPAVPAQTHTAPSAPTRGGTSSSARTQGGTKRLGVDTRGARLKCMSAYYGRDGSGTESQSRNSCTYDPSSRKYIADGAGSARC
ncbi:hypothetical protein LshimejAT787_0905610 [Lyophyllum shimeji]|uniref:Uncharacterized protein n=1 Tax=Lyophyllum shimeji TaxID=47721 RepID=A0A9P3PTC6_LYOSH|nr:hypothetical protein LshimejAT787_0905610 [Lyophyllum shimeji]